MVPSTIAFAAAAESPADLRLEWVGGDAAVSGKVGQTVELKTLLRNVGGRGAFAAVVKTHTSLGPFGDPVRVQPGPAAGASLPRTITIPLALGMRELCVEVALQNVAVDDSQDPNPRDNRICRAIKVFEKEKSSGADQE
jgi:hypothetical protein